MTGYAFRTTWRIGASPERVWRELERVVAGEAVAWWPAFRVSSPGTLAPGARLGVLVRAPLGYRLRMVLTVAEVAPGRSVSARSAGDLEGAGILAVAPDAAGSIVRITWDVALRRPWMRAASPVLRPLFVAAHAVVMRQGEKGLRRAVETRPSAVRNPPNPAR